MKYLALFLALITLLCGQVSAADNLLKNGDFSEVSDGRILPAGWGNLSKKCELSIDKENLPVGISASVKVVPKSEEVGQGSFSQKIYIKADAPEKLVLSGYIRAEAYNEGFIQVKLYKSRKELKRLNSKTTQNNWQKVSIAVNTQGVDRIEVLCRWKRNKHYVGKAVWFADLKLIPVGKSLAVVGDSTVQNYPQGSNRRGWGQMLPKFFTEQLLITNFAAGGRSSKTFRSEKRWDSVLAAKPDYVLIQFGHNDSHEKGRPESTDAKGDFKDYMIKYVDEAKAAGIVPILVTPPARRIFNKDGSISKIFIPYVETVKAIAKDKDVLCVDLYDLSCKKYHELGEEKTLEYFCSSKDRSHFSEAGATFLAEKIVGSISKNIPDLASTLK